MICKYSHKQKELNNGRYYLVCNLTNTQCIMVRFCRTINDIVNIDNVDKKCNLYINKENVEYMKQGKYKVLFEKRGKLCVQINNDTAIMINNPFSETPLGVDLVKIKDEYYVKGFEPKKVEEEPKMFSDVVELKKETLKKETKKKI